MNTTSSPQNTIYICSLCNKQFDDKSNYNRHTRKNKTACISKEQCQQIVEENKFKDNKLKYFETKTEKQKRELKEKETEIQRLKDLVSKFSEKEEFIKDSLEQVVDQVIEMKDEVVESSQKFNCTQIENQTNINNLNYNDNKTLFNISISKDKQERLDHITKDMMMGILNQKNYNITLKNLTTTIYFHPLAPQNWRWCVTDFNSPFGAVEYNHETNTLIRNDTTQVIKKNMQNVMFGVADILEELRVTRNFNKPQSVNYHRLINAMGNEFTNDEIKSMKESAYEGRNFPKALWDRVDVQVESTPATSQIRGLK